MENNNSTQQKTMITNFPDDLIEKIATMAIDEEAIFQKVLKQKLNKKPNYGDMCLFFQDLKYETLENNLKDIKTEKCILTFYYKNRQKISVLCEKDFLENSGAIDFFEISYEYQNQKYLMNVELESVISVDATDLDKNKFLTFLEPVYTDDGDEEDTYRYIYNDRPNHITKIKNPHYKTGADDEEEREFLEIMENYKNKNKNNDNDNDSNSEF